MCVMFVFGVLSSLLLHADCGWVWYVEVKGARWWEGWCVVCMRPNGVEEFLCFQNLFIHMKTIYVVNCYDIFECGRDVMDQHIKTVSYVQCAVSEFSFSSQVKCASLHRNILDEWMKWMSAIKLITSFFARVE